MAKFCDLSHWNQVTDWSKINTDGVILKCGGGDAGSYQDKTYLANKTESRKRGLFCGSYYFAGHGNPVAEAEYYLSIVGDILEGEILALDAETGQTADWCKTFLDHITSKLGFKPFLYAPVGSWKVALDYPLWIMRYGRNNGQINEDMQPNIGQWNAFTMWQYTSAGQVNGINGRVDLSIFPGSSLKPYGKQIQTPQVSIQPSQDVNKPTENVDIQPTQVNETTPIVETPTKSPQETQEIVPTPEQFITPKIDPSMPVLQPDGIPTTPEPQTTAVAPSVASQKLPTDQQQSLNELEASLVPFWERIWSIIKSFFKIN